MPIPVYPGVFLEPSPDITGAQIGGIDEFKTLTVIGTKGTTGSASNNVVTDIVSYADYQAKFGTDGGADLHVKAIFDNYSQIGTRKRLKFIAGLGSGGSPTLNDNLRAGLAVINSADDWPSGILLVPQTSGLTAGSQLNTFIADVDTVAKAKGLLFMFGFLAATNTASLAVSAVASWAAPERSSAVYYGWNRLGVNASTDVSIATIAAAHAIRTFDDVGQFEPPAGKYAIAAPNIQPGVVTNADQELLFPAEINYAKRLMDGQGNFSFTAWGTKMLSTDATEGCTEINTYVASVVTEKTVQRNIQVFRPTGFDSTALELKSTIANRLNQLADAGAYQQNVTPATDILVQTESGLQTIPKNVPIGRGYVLFEPVIKAGVAYIDFCYFPVSTLNQVVIRVARVIV